jgi:ribose transport system permease protein
MATTSMQQGSVPSPDLGVRNVAATKLKRLAGQAYLPLGIGAVILIGSLLSPYFFTWANFQNIVVTGAVVSVLAVGQFMVVVTAGIDLSVGKVAALSTVVAAVSLRSGIPWPVSVLATLGVGVLAGLVNGAVVVFGRITPFIATLGMLSIAQGISFQWQGGTYIEITRPGFISFFNGKVFGIPSPVIIFVGVMLFFAAVMRWTTFGRQQYAIGGNAEAARLSGLPVKRNVVAAYAISGLLAALAGLLLAAQLGQGNSLVANGYELDAIAAAVVGGASLFGGVGNPVAAVLGGLLIGTISNVMDLRGVQAQPQLIIKGLLILTAVFMTSGAGADIRSKLQRRVTARWRAAPERLEASSEEGARTTR